VFRQLSFPVEWPSRHQTDEEKGDRNDAEEDDYQTENSFRDEPEHEK
jgi:hypothetical protein